MASLIVSASAPPSMQIMPLREDGLSLKILGPKIIAPTTTLLHDQKAKKRSNSRMFCDNKLFKSHCHR